MKRFLFSMGALPVAVLLCCVVIEALAQSPAGSDSPQEGVVLTKLSQLVYPPLARAAGVTGDVNLTIEVRQDGSVQAAEVVSGHPLLRQAALDSARVSQFECRKCSDAVTSSRIVYTFQLLGPETCCKTPSDGSDNDKPVQPTPPVILPQNHVTIVLERLCICDPAPDVVKVRSLKCLYIWKCGIR
jgi:TonB family protein